MKTTITLSKYISTEYLRVGAIALIALIITALALVGCNPLTILAVFGILVLICTAAYFSGSLIATKVVTDKKRYLTDVPDKFPWGDEQTAPAELTSVNNMPEPDGLELIKQDIVEFDPKCDIDDEQFTYTYQGGFFQIQSVDSNVIRIFFPKIYTATVLQQDMVCRSINRINSCYAVCKLVASADTQNMSVDVHGFADFPYTGDHDKRMKLLKDVMAVFFDMQRSLFISMAVSETLQQETDAPEPDEFSTSYKDISLN